MDPALHRDVEADRGFIQEQNAGTVKECGGDFALHPLAERKVADGFLKKLAEVEQFGKFVDGRLIVSAWYPVDSAVSLERVDYGNVPDELVPLSHYERNVAQEIAVPFRGYVSEHVRFARFRVEESGQHFQAGRFARPVRPEKADNLSLIDGEADLVDRFHLARFPVDEALERRREAGLAFGNHIGLAELTDLDRGHRQAEAIVRAFILSSSSSTPRPGPSGTVR